MDNTQCDLQLHPFVLPIMQGFFQVASFSIVREPVADEEGDSVIVEYNVISRRSRDRAGLRYQRRGIDDDANVANFVETETVMRVEVGYNNIYTWIKLTRPDSVKVYRMFSAMSRSEDQVGRLLSIASLLLLTVVDSSAVLEPTKHGAETGPSTEPGACTRSTFARHSATSIEGCLDVWTAGASMRATLLTRLLTTYTDDREPRRAAR